jgi:hypothetical protein
MRRLLSSLPSPAMLVALLALFVALGGSAYAVKKTAAAPANSVVTKSIKKGAVTRLKLATGAVGATQILAGAVGAPQMAEGGVGTAQIANDAVTGAKVGKGTITASNIDLTTLGIPKPTTYTVRDATVTHSFAPESTFQLLAECLPGEVATGGGGRSANGRIWLAESIPFVDSTGQRWGVELHNPTNETLNEQVTTYVICASA